MPRNTSTPPHRAFALRTLTLLIACIGTAQAESVKLTEVTVTATRTQADAASVPATVTSIDREALDRRLPGDAADLFAGQPDVVMPRDLRRFGATRVNIRGIEDNRVIQMVDGVRLPDYYNGGGPTNFTMNASPTAMTDFLKRVEIVRGPASSLYGSDAIGGVVGFVTLDPADLLGRDETRALRYRGAYSGPNEGLTHTVLGALRHGAVELLLGYAHGQGRELDNQGEVGTVSPTRTRPNPQDTRDTGVLAKLVLKPATGHRFTALIEGREQAVEADILRLVATLPRVTMMRGDDHTERLRASLEWEHLTDRGWYDRLALRAFRQESRTRNHNVQRRTNTSTTCAAGSGSGSNCYIEQDFFFDQDTLGAGLQSEKLLGAGAIEHQLTWGLDVSRVETAQLRDARVWRTSGPAGGLAVGQPGVTAPHKTLAGDAFPLRDFAPGRTDTVGLFVQDAITLADARWVITPGLRYDWRKLEPEPDALSQAVLAATGKRAVTQQDGAFSPRLGVLWRATPEWSAFGQLARGFRAPNYDEVNGHFRNTTQSYGVAPNPELDPETSIGLELGLRLNRPGLRGQISVYDNHYRDFIESVRLNCPADPSCIVGLNNTNQAVNLNKVRIYGAELRAAWSFAPGWRVDGGLAYAHGTNEGDGRPINSIEPARLSLALVREAATWGAEGRLRAAAKKDRVNDFSGTTFSPWFRPPGYEVVDLSLWYRPRQDVRLTASIDNLFDQKYWLWGDIRQADARNPAGVDFYSQPGRTLSLAVQVDL